LFYLFNKQQKVNTIVCPSNSTVKLFEQNKRFKNNRIIHIPTFVKEVNKTIIDNIDVRTRFKNKCFAFWGRVDEDKGVEVFVKAILYLKNNNFDIKAKIFGFTDNEYSYSLLDFINKNNLQNIEVYPFLEKTELMEKISFCTGSILPSLWYDNMPNSLIESQSLGIPVIASEIGCFPELIDTENGLTFETNNHIDLAAKIKELIFSEVKYQKYVENSLLWSSNYCTVESHYNSLMKEFENIKKNDYK
jgi:glycosyltransferase involved in cell wall biosynthesis